MWVSGLCGLTPSFIAPGHRENINFFGFITVDIEAELSKLIEGWRPLRPTRVHDAGLPFLLNPWPPGAEGQEGISRQFRTGTDAAVEPLS